jgi:two-component system CheB/CheR fusion protein
MSPPAESRTIDNNGRRQRPRTRERAGDIPVVALGASAGGLEPIGRFLEAMPIGSNLAFIVIQHLDPNSRSLLPELLTKHTAMRVRPAEDGLVLMPNEVYVIPPGVYLSIAAGMLHSSAAQAGRGARMPIDVLLHSLAAERGNRGIGVVLSGTGTDGAEGLKALKAAGGLTLVQEPSEAQQDGMPRYAILTAHPDHVLPVREMPAAITRYVAHDYAKNPQAPSDRLEAGAPEPPELGAAVEILKSSTGQSLERYKPGTLERRIERRMALHGIAAWPDYLELLRRSPAEAKALSKDLLINVTTFFRDPEAFAVLKETVLPRLLDSHPDHLPVRIWVAGCSTGEEVYSLGMLILEQIAVAGRNLVLQIFATDIDDEALQIARAGVYPETAQALISAQRLERFFVREDGRIKIAKELRDAVIFSRHNLLTDPPFSRLDLVSCRNLLIYLKPEAQRRALALFHFALSTDGVLFLGSAESVVAATALFEPIDEKRRIYRRLGRGQAARAAMPLLARGDIADSRISILRPAPPRSPALPDLVQRTMLDAYAPAAVVTNREFMPLYYVGATSRYLEIAAGEPDQDVLAMAREGLRAKLRETIRRAFQGKRRSVAHGVGFKRDGKTARVTIEVLPLADEHDDLVLVSFIDEPLRPEDDARRVADKAGAHSELAQLRQQLSDNRRELNRTILDLKRANEALKTNNEDAMLLNEEFLSTNEELESSKEELQSLNEELTTLNIQLRQSLEQQQQASTDLSNLLNSSPVATILLDAQLCIKLFNPRMRALFSLIDADIGRPLADLLPKFADPQLLADVTAARSTGDSHEREIRAESGAWYLRSALPYRTETGAVQGAVVTFADVSQLKRAELDGAAARAYAETIVDTVREPLIVLNSELAVVSANTAFQSAFDLTAEQVVGKALSALPQRGILARPQLFGLLAEVRTSEQRADPVELEIDEPESGHRIWRVNARLFRLPSAERPMILLALDDVTDEQLIARGQLQLMIDALPGAFLAVDNQRCIRSVSGQVGPLFGYRPEELIGRSIDILVPPELRDRHSEMHATFVAKPDRRPMGSGLDICGITKEGERIPLDIGLSPVPTASGPLIVTAVHDLRPQKLAEEQLRAAKAQADRANQAKSRFLAAASHDLRQPLQTIRLFHGVLEKRIVDPEVRTVLGGLDDTVTTMAELLDTLLDVDQIERGAIEPEITEFAVGAVLSRKTAEFAPQAAAKGLMLRVVPCSVTIRSDRHLLERLIGNLLSNAVKYTERGKILLGCRRRGGVLRIEVWDTGIGIPQDRLPEVFDEFYRVDHADSSKLGLGLGLYIVRRLALLLGHKVEVRSTAGKGTVFALIVPIAEIPASQAARRPLEDTSRPTILLVEDNVGQLEALRGLLEIEGFRVTSARTGAEALERLRGSAAIVPDLVVADNTLPGEMTGLQVIEHVRSHFGAGRPALIVSGDNSLAAKKAFKASGVMFINKPVKAATLLSAVAALLRISNPLWPETGQRRPGAAVPVPARAGFDVAVIDDDPNVRDALAMLLESDGFAVASYPSAEAFFADAGRGRFRCLLVDLRLTGMDGFAVQKRLKSEQPELPVIFVTGSGDLPMAVKAMREGAADFLQKPVRRAALQESLARVMEAGRQDADHRALREEIAARRATLTERERQVMDRMLAGEATKNVAADLGISERTAEHHRQSVMRKMAAKSLAMLIRMVG